MDRPSHERLTTATQCTTMSDKNSDSYSGSSETAREQFSARLLRSFVELNELRSTRIARQLGYFGTERFVVFGYCAGGSEVIWRDSHSSGFGFGGWKQFLWHIEPLAARYGVSLGNEKLVGTHVLVIDRAEKVVYAAPRKQAEEFLAEVYGVSPPKRPCLCSRINCALCVVQTCAHASEVSQPAVESLGERQIEAETCGHLVSDSSSAS